MISPVKPVLKIADLVAHCERRTTMPSKWSAKLPAASACEAFGGRIGLDTDAFANGNRASGGGWDSPARRYYAMGDWPEAVPHGEEAGNQASNATLPTKPQRT